MKNTSLRRLKSTLVVLVITCIGNMTVHSQTKTNETLESLLCKVNHANTVDEVKALAEAAETREIGMLLYTLHLMEYDYHEKDSLLSVESENVFERLAALERARMKMLKFYDEELFQNMISRATSKLEEFYLRTKYSKYLFHDNQDDESAIVLNIDSFQNLQCERLLLEYNMLRANLFASQRKYYEEEKVLLDVINKNSLFFTPTAFANLAIKHIRTNQKDSARLYIKKAITASDKIGLPSARYYGTLGNLYSEKAELTNSNELRDTARLFLLKSIEEVGYFSYEKAVGYLNIGFTYDKDSKAKLKYFNKARGIIDSIGGNFRFHQFIFRQLGFEYSKSNKIDSAYLMSKQALVLTDSIWSQDRAKIAAEADAKYAVSKAEAEAAEQKLLTLEERNRKRTSFFFLSLAIITAGIIALLYFKSQKISREREQTALELKAQKDSIQHLNRELNHRTSNQISLAYELILDQRRQIGDEQAKASLERSESQLMALREVNRALAHRSDDLVRVDEVLTKVAENLQAASPHPFTLDLQLKEITVHGNAASRSALILSELMSNSIKYAFPNTESPAATISLSQTENETSISYLDNGPGTDGTVRGTGVGSGLIEAMLEDLDAEWEQITGEDGSGYGMRWWWR